VEKWLLRTAFEGCLPESILWRQKEQFSDGVGYGWIDGLKAHAEAQVSDAEFAGAERRFPINPPQTKEAYFYRRIFETHFPGGAAAATVPGGKSIACSSPAAIAWDAAFGEGWALYAETLGPDLGLYTDPYNAFGALASEIGCAARLVVDTGLHAKGWTRAQAIDYFRANTVMGEADIAAQIDRHIARPGESVACKVGELKIQELRRRAQAALGPRFDIRAFHAQVVEGGSLPLAVLEARIDRWIAAQE
jgi:hypothetical protein